MSGSYSWTSRESALAHANKHAPSLGKTPHKYLLMSQRRLRSPNKSLIRMDRDANVYSDRENNILVVRRRDNKIITFYPRMKKMADFPSNWEISDIGLYRKYTFMSDRSREAFSRLVAEYIAKIKSKNETVEEGKKFVEIFVSAEPPMRHDFLLAKAFDILYSHSMRIGGSADAIREAMLRR